MILLGPESRWEGGRYPLVTNTHNVENDAMRSSRSADRRVSERRTDDRVLVARDVRPDSRKRVSLGSALTDLGDASFAIYRDSRGRIILEPQVSIPADEAWLFRNTAAKESVARGLKQIESAKALGSFAGHADDDEA